ncbi:MAG TPA: magnesium transporter [Anaerolineales bacterium]|nr:magnesium transporter [Anaerolineales bacterium]
MNPAELDQILAQLQDMLQRSDIDAAIKTIESLRPPDQADLLSELDEDQQVALLIKLNPADSADILEELEDENAAELMAALPPDTAVKIVDKMEPDEVADVLAEISAEHTQEIIERMEDPQEIHPLLIHPTDSAGGLMTSEYLALRRRMTTEDAIAAMRQWQPDAETIYYLFVVDRHGRLSGVVDLRQLIVAAADSTLEEIMDTDVISVPAGTDQEECARLMSRYDLLALPVVDHQDLLIGVITIDDLVEVLEDEATEDIQRFGGSEPLDQPYLTSSVLGVARKRVGWLMLLFITESLTGTVLRHFEGELQSVVALAFFVPLLIGTGGNAGSQTTSTIIRALALGEIDLKDAFLSLWHELRVGFFLGLGMAAIAYFRALTWGSEPGLALTVSVAIFTIVMWANGLGAILPMIALRLNIDPTVVSGPVMSTLVDATGLFIYFTLARYILGL